MQSLADDANHPRGSSNAMRLSSGAALVLIGLGRRSVAGAIIAAFGGSIAYDAFRRRPADMTARDGSGRAFLKVASVANVEKLRHQDAPDPPLADRTAAQASSNIAHG